MLVSGLASDQVFSFLFLRISWFPQEFRDLKGAGSLAILLSWQPLPVRPLVYILHRSALGLHVGLCGAFVGASAWTRDVALPLIARRFLDIVISSCITTQCCLLGTYYFLFLVWVMSYYLLLTVYYILFIMYYLLFTSYYLLITISIDWRVVMIYDLLLTILLLFYISPTTWYLLPATYALLFTTFHLLLTTYYVLITTYLLFVTRYSLLLFVVYY